MLIPAPVTLERSLNVADGIDRSAMARPFAMRCLGSFCNAFGNLQGAFHRRFYIVEKHQRHAIARGESN